MFRYIKNTKGMTLMEVIVSIAILSIIIVPVSNMFLTTVKINRHSRDLLIANEYGQRVIEEQRVDSNLTDSSDISVTLPDGNNVAVNYSSVDDTHVLTEQNVPLFHGKLVLEANNNNQVELYRLDSDDNYYLEQTLIGVTDYRMDIYSDRIEINGSSLNYANERPVLIGIECYNNLNISLNVYNHIEDYVEIYVISYWRTNDFASSTVTVNNKYGKVSIIQKENTVNQNADTHLLKKIDVTAQTNEQSVDLNTYKLKD